MEIEQGGRGWGESGPRLFIPLAGDPCDDHQRSADLFLPRVGYGSLRRFPLVLSRFHFLPIRIAGSTTSCWFLDCVCSASWSTVVPCRRRHLRAPMVSKCTCACLPVCLCSYVACFLDSPMATLRPRPTVSNPSFSSTSMICLFFCLPLQLVLAVSMCLRYTRDI